MSISEKELKILVKETIKEYLTSSEEFKDFVTTARSNQSFCPEEVPNISTIDRRKRFVPNPVVPDITAIDLQKRLLVPDPVNSEAYLALKAKSPARVGVWRSGPRMKTETLLRFWADHAASQDAVAGEVSEELTQKLDMLAVQTKCKDKAEYLTRTDLGRQFDDEEIAKISQNCDQNPQVQIIVADGLSATAIERNIEDIIPAIKLGLEVEKIATGRIIFVKYGRVPAMDVISEVTGADVCCLLVGERPGLVTGESMSAYIAYRATVGMPEANRTVVSNIYSGGTPTVEAGAHIAYIIKEMLDKQASGVNLKL